MNLKLKLCAIAPLLICGCIGLVSFDQARGQAQDAGDGQVPDFSGIWSGEAWSTEGWPLDPPFTEAGRAAQEKWEAEPENDPSHRCIVPLGRIISAPMPYEIIQQDERLTLLYEYDHQVRRVYMDGRDHPSDQYPTMMGHSIGWWDGDTLVIETKILEAGLFRTQGLPYTENLVLTERFTMVGDDRMRMEIIIDDPVYYREPWKVTRFYKRGEEEIKDYTCIVREHLSG